MEILYCEKWWIIEKKPLKPMSEESARLRHQKRQSYTAILSKNGQPRFIINIADKWVSIAFLDDLYRKYLQYDFKEIKSDKIFLNTVIYWEYEDNSDSEISTMMLRYQESGDILMEKRNLKTGEVEERETHDNVERNWEDYPLFGQYMFICKEER